jgi:ComF family protein
VNTLEFVTDLFFPKQNSNFSSVHTYLTDAEIDNEQSHFKILDKNQKQVLESVFIASHLDNKLVSDLIHRAKIGLEYAISEDLTRLLLEKVKAQDSISNPDLIVSIPPDPNRFLSRGYHLPELISKYLSQSLDVEFANVVYKPQSTPQQTRLNRTERLGNLKNKFQLIQPQQVNLSKYHNIWLVDDVTTTGSTLYEVASVVKHEFPFVKIYGLVVASN